MAGSHLHFIDVVVAHRDLMVTSAFDHAWRLEPRESELAWYCDLDDGTSSSGESDPATHVRWVCPPLRIRGTETTKVKPRLNVAKLGPRTDLGKLIGAFRRLTDRTSERAPGEGTEQRYVYTDPGGILTADLRRRIEHWPSAPHGDGVERPAELSAIRITREGLVVESASWWDSASALDHQMVLASDVARRVWSCRGSNKI